MPKSDFMEKNPFVVVSRLIKTIHVNARANFLITKDSAIIDDTARYDTIPAIDQGTTLINISNISSYGK
jgi:hypothetical protein